MLIPRVRWRTSGARAVFGPQHYFPGRPPPTTIWVSRRPVRGLRRRKSQFPVGAGLGGERTMAMDASADETRGAATVQGQGAGARVGGGELNQQTVNADWGYDGTCAGARSTSVGVARLYVGG